MKCGVAAGEGASDANDGDDFTLLVEHRHFIGQGPVGLSFRGGYKLHLVEDGLFGFDDLEVVF